MVLTANETLDSVLAGMKDAAKINLATEKDNCPKPQRGEALADCEGFSGSMQS